MPSRKSSAPATAPGGAARGSRRRSTQPPGERAPECTPPAAAGEAAEGDPAGRVNQKRRTRQALIEAALALREAGREPSFAEVAQRAMVSRATAYRYFSSVEALVRETVAERALQPLEDAWRPGQDPVEAIGRGARAFSRVLLDDEVGLHVMERSFMAVWLEQRGERAARPGRRLRLIRPVVDALKAELAPAARRRLVQALAMVIGTEAVIAVRDIAGASPDEAVECAAWAAQALVRQALAEAGSAKHRRATAARGSVPGGNRASAGAGSAGGTRSKSRAPAEIRTGGRPRPGPGSRPDRDLDAGTLPPASSRPLSAAPARRRPRR